MNVSVLIATANRADQLADTLASLSGLRTVGATELIVVDNNSTDATRDVVAAAADRFPFPVRYVFEAEQGKYAAMNTGIRAARGAILASTDDDARFEIDWPRESLNAVTRTDIKKYNAEVHSQSAIEGTIELRDAHNIQPDQIDEVEVAIFRTAC